MGCCSSNSEPINPERVDHSHFKLLRVIGKGGFGKVTAVEHRIDGQTYAQKSLSKAEIIKTPAELEGAWIERQVLSSIHSEFLTRLHWAYQDETHVHLIMEFLSGGDLAYHLKNPAHKNGLPESAVKFYAAEILIGMMHLNAHDFIYRDLKPANILLDGEGHIHISDFGLCFELTKENKFRCKGTAGTSGYLAPEVLKKKYYGASQDVWSYGITLYELLTNKLPFRRSQYVLEDDVKFPSALEVSDDLIDLIRGLLQKHPLHRLGCGSEGWKEVMEHKWFSDLNWDTVLARKLTPPFIPLEDVANCSAMLELEAQLGLHEEETTEPLTEQEQDLFLNFEYNTECLQKVEVEGEGFIEPESPHFIARTASMGPAALAASLRGSSSSVPNTLESTNKISKSTQDDLDQEEINLQSLDPIVP